MRINQYLSQEQIRNGIAAQAGREHGAAEFLSQKDRSLPGAVQQLAGGLDRINAVVTEDQIRKRNELLDLDLLKDMQDLQDTATTWTDQYQQHYQGREAVNAETDARAFFKDKLDALSTRWSGNPRALRYVQEHAGGLALSGVNAMRDYGNKQQEVCKDSVFSTEVERFKSVAGDWRSTPEQIDAAYRDFQPRYSAYLRSKGLDPELADLKTASLYREAMDTHHEQSFLARTKSGDIPGAQAELAALQAGDPAAFAARRESGAAGVTAVGYDAKGGTSYGTYQISSSSMPDFLSYLDKQAPALATRLRSAGPADTGSKSGRMPTAWRQIAAEDPDTFANLQKAFIQESHVDPVLNSLPADARSLVENNPALASALWSTAVQHGAKGGQRLFADAWSKSGGNAERFLGELYAERKEQFGGSTPEVRASVQRRLDEERDTLVDLSRNQPAKIAGMQQMLQAAAREQEKTAQAQAVQAEYAKLPALVQDLPFEQWDHAVLGSIASLPREVGRGVRSLWEQEKGFQQEAIKANDARIVSELFTEFDHLPPGLRREAVNARRSELLQQGLSPHEGFALLDQRLKEGDVETPQNIAALNQLYQRVAQGALDSRSSDQVRGTAYAAGLTEAQTKKLIEFKEGGGQMGLVRKNLPTIRAALDYYADNKDQRKKIEETDYLKALVKVLPTDRAPNDDDIYKAVGTLFKNPDLLQAAVEAGSGAGRDYALWRPDVDNDDYTQREAQLRKEWHRQPSRDEVLLSLRQDMGIPGGVPNSEVSRKRVRRPGLEEGFF